MSEPLLSRAREQFGDLSAAEKQLFEQITNGPADVERSEDRSIRSECLEWLCSRQSDALGYGGIQLSNAEITGSLNLKYINFDKPLVIRRSAIAGSIDISYGDLFLLDLTETKFDQLNATGSVFHRSLKLEAAIANAIKLNLANIHGSLDCHGCQVLNALCEIEPDKYVFDADSIRVQGNAFLSGGFFSNGSLCFLGAVIEGELSCSGGHFSSIHEDTFVADSIHIGKQLCFERAKVFGAACFVAAKIDGDVSFRGTTLVADIPHGKALCFDAVQVGHDMTLSDETESLSVSGTISFVNARIKDTLSICGIDRPDKMGLDLRFAKVRTLKDDCESWPEPRQLHLTRFEYQTVIRSCSNESTAMRTTRSSVEIAPHLNWLSRRYILDDFVAYDVLAAALRMDGKEDIAKGIQIEKWRQRRRLDPLLLRLSKRLFSDILMAYGYNPIRLLLLWLLFFIAGSICFEIGYKTGLITQAGYERMTLSTTSDRQDGEAVLNQQEGQGMPIVIDYCSENYPPFNAFIFSLDTLAPVIDMQQERYWYMGNRNANAQGNRPPHCKELSQEPKLFGHLGMAMTDLDRESTENVIRWYLRLHILAGWITTTSLIVFVTSFIKPQES